MGIFKRITDLVKSNQHHKDEETHIHFLETIKVGDILEIDLQEFAVTGTVHYFDKGYDAHRFAYYLRNGKEITCLLIDKGRAYDCFMCRFKEGSLDDPNDVPSRILVDEVPYNLEYYRTDRVQTSGQTDFRSNDSVIYWRYLGEKETFFILQYQDGKYVAMEAERIPELSIQVMQS